MILYSLVRLLKAHNTLFPRETAQNTQYFILVLVRYQVLFDTDRHLNFVRYSILDTYDVIKSNFHIEHSSQ